VTSPQEPRSLARARALRPGDRLAVLCVSGPVDPEPLAAGLDALRCAGLDPCACSTPHSASRAQLVPAEDTEGIDDTEDRPAARARRASPACIRRGHSGPP